MMARVTDMERGEEKIDRKNNYEFQPSLGPWH